MSFVEDTTTKVTTVTPAAGYLPAGKYIVRAESIYGFALPSVDFVEVAWKAGEPSAAQIQASYTGGNILNIFGENFDRDVLSQNKVEVCGIPA